VKEKDTIKGEALEKINDELFGSFDPEDESWIGGGGSKTSTSWITYSPCCVDAAFDFDWNFAELENAGNMA
jgi:hypothetical protein